MKIMLEMKDRVQCARACLSVLHSAELRDVASVLLDLVEYQQEQLDYLRRAVESSRYGRL